VVVVSSLLFWKKKRRNFRSNKRHLISDQHAKREEKGAAAAAPLLHTGRGRPADVIKVSILKGEIMNWRGWGVEKSPSIRDSEMFSPPHFCAFKRISSIDSTLRGQSDRSKKAWN